jgi:hypothetical protein
LADPAFRKKVNGLVQTRRQVLGGPAWFQQTHKKSPLSCVAYFGMEFMLSEALPIYSGGYIYSAAVSVARPPADYTARLLPRYDGVAIPLEEERILWQR